MASIFDIIAALGGSWFAANERIDLADLSDPDAIGKEMYDLAVELYPLNRSITGSGLRQSFDLLQSVCKLEQFEVPSGTQVYDWQVPDEWIVNDAYVEDESGNRVIDIADSNLHLVGYSDAVQKTMSFEDLIPHLHTIPERPEWIPYRTMYYTDGWGFCLSHKQLEGLSRGRFYVHVDTEKRAGSLTYAECYSPGAVDDEILFFAHCCHPSLCNDNLSGMVVAALLGRVLANCELRHSVRIVFAPATIGSIAWLAHNEKKRAKIKAGFVLSVLGDEGHFRVKESRQGDSLAEKASKHALRHGGEEFAVLAYSPWGYDERQFCSPGIDLPVVRLTRTPNGEYPEYHTSADNLSLIKPYSLHGSLLACLRIIAAIESDIRYVNLCPNGEPQLGRRGLYGELGGFQNIEELSHAMLWLLNQSDGSLSVLDIAAKSGMSCELLQRAAGLLCDKQLLVESGQV